MKKLAAFLSLALLAAPALSHAEQRIIAIGGAITETVYALGQAEKLIGSDTTSYYPPAAANLPKVGYQRALSTEGILSLKPNLILATEDAGPASVIKQLKTTGVQITTLKSAKSVADVKTNILQLGHILNVDDTATTLVKNLENSLAALKKTKETQSQKVRVLFLMNHGAGAPMVAGRNTSADNIIALAGAVNVVSDYERYKPLTPESAVKYAPDAIIVSTQTFDQIGGADKLLALPGLGITPAGKAGRIITMDALLLLGFGPRTVDAAIELNEKLYVQ